jgi:cytochrome c-type biogenesis protein CcmH
MTRRLVLALLLVAAVATALPPAALAVTPKTSLNEVEAEVMCVVCGVPLNIAESPQADRERALINELVKQGKTKEEVKAALVTQYGRAVLADPDDSGASIANWLIPVLVVVALLAGVGVIAPRWLRRQRAKTAAAGAAADPTAPELDPDDARRLDEDLARYR